MAGQIIRTLLLDEPLKNNNIPKLTYVRVAEVELSLVLQEVVVCFQQ